MENSTHPDWRRPLPPEVTLPQGSYRHPVFFVAQLRCFIRTAEIMETWRA